MRPAWIRLLLACLLTGAAASVQAAYDIDIDAPKSVRGLLKDFLDLSRYQKRDDLSAEQFQFLIDTAPDQVRDLLSTEGYFLPETRITVDKNGDKRVVHISVDPKERTLVSDVAIKTTGAI